MSKKIYFLTPDLGVPSGGPKVIYQTVDMLNEMGYNAFIMHKQRYFRCKYAKSLKNLKYVYLEDSQYIDPEDILVIPEPDVLVMDAILNLKCKKVVFNQNWAYTYAQFRQLKNSEKVKYQQLGFHDVLTVTEKIKDFLEFSMGEDLNIGVMHPYLSNNFKAKPLKDKVHRIAFMPRKNHDKFQEIFSTLYAKSKDEIVWEQIDNKSEEQVAQILNDCTMFLALGYPEGLSLPPLEAMKSGCVVLGYSGYGGLEYMVGDIGFMPREFPVGYEVFQNMFLFPDGDVVDLSKRIYQVWMDLKEKKYDEYQVIADEGVKTALKFEREQSKKMLDAFFKSLVN